MDFESTYKKYMDGTASSEEIEFVEQELEKAKKMTEIIDSYGASATPVVQECDDETVKKAKKSLTKKSIVRTLIISLVVLLVVAAIILSAVFGTAFGAANKACNYSEEDAKQIALRFAADYVDNPSAKLYVTDCEREIEYSSDLRHSVYVYEIEVQYGLEYEIELHVNAKTGIVTITDIDAN